MRNIWSEISIICASLILVFTLPSCGRDANANSGMVPFDCPEETCIYLAGRFSQQHIDALTDAGESIDRIVVNSVGGRSGYARSIAEFIYKNDVDLIIYEECSSACFEFLVPAARTVTALNEPVVAVHGNPFTLEILLAREGYSAPEHCHRPSFHFLKTVYGEKSLSMEFTYKSIEMLGNIEIDFNTYKSGCLSSFSMKSENEYWAPNSMQIQQLLGISISGSLCADSADDCI